jgi:hypothetical protein
MGYVLDDMGKLDGERMPAACTAGAMRTWIDGVKRMKDLC